LAPLGEYDGITCAVAAMRAVAAITVAIASAVIHSWLCGCEEWLMDDATAAAGGPSVNSITPSIQLTLLNDADVTAAADAGGDDAATATTIRPSRFDRLSITQL